MATRIESGLVLSGQSTRPWRASPFWINYDHDNDCRKAIGGPFTVWLGYMQSNGEFTQGRPKTFSRKPGDELGWAGMWIVNKLRCIALKDELWITIGFMDHPDRFETMAHKYWSMKLRWVNLADPSPRFEAYTRKE